MKDLGRDKSVGRLLERALRTRAAANSPEACPDAETLAAWSDGTLTAIERASVDAHAADCARCQVHLAAMARMTPGETPQSTLESAIRSAIRNPRSAIRAAGAARWLVPAAAAAAALSLWVWVQPGPAPETTVRLDTPAASAGVPPAPAAEPPAPVEALPARAEPALARAQPPSARVQAQQGAAASTPARAAAAPKEEASARDSIVAERRIENDIAGGRARPGAPGAEALRERASVNAPAIAAAPSPLSAFADSAAERPLEIASPDPSSRWRVSGSTILRSTDAGATWQPQSPGVDGRFTAGASPQPFVCWLVGRRGIVLLSTDGRTWRRIVFPEAVDLVGVKASSAASASITTADGRTLTTSDAGATWVATP